jgi:tripeptidyl-peptidase-1
LIISIVVIVYFDVVSSFQLKSRTPYAVKDRHNVPRQWNRVGQAPAVHIIELQIGLKQGNFDELERHLYEGRTQSPASHNMERNHVVTIALDPMGGES